MAQPLRCLVLFLYGSIYATFGGMVLSTLKPASMFLGTRTLLESGGIGRLLESLRQRDMEVEPIAGTGCGMSHP